MLQIGKSTRPRLRDIGALTDRVTAWSLRHRTLAVAGWLAFVAAAVLAGALMPTDGARATDPGDSGRAQRALRAQPVEAPILENVLVERAAPGGPRLAGDPGARAAVADLVASLRRAPGVAVRSPYEPGARDLLSADGRSGLVTIQVSGPADGLRSRSDRAQATIRTVAARHPGIRLDQAGDRSLSVSVDQGIKADLRHAELISLPLTVAVLLLIFGSAVAAALPLLLAATAVLGAFGLLQVVAYWVPVNSASSAMVLLIGVAVGVDYALFYVRRVREERTAGRPTGAALLTATRTSGHVIVVSGVTVMLCLTGLVLTGLDNFRGVAAGTVLVVGMAMAGSVTALPGLLALLGDRVNAGRLPWLGRRRQAATGSRAWAALARSVVRRPLAWGLGGALLLTAMAVPALGMRAQDAAVTDSLPPGEPTVAAALRMARAFPGAPTPARVVVWSAAGRPVDGPQVRAAIEELRRRAAEPGDGVAGPITVAPVGAALELRVPLAGTGTDPTSTRALSALRSRELPATLGRVAGIQYAVAGRTAFAADFTARLTSRTPLVFGFVLLLAFGALALVFRSPAVAAASIVLNLLTVGAAYGVLTWVFQDGHLAGPLGFTAYGGIVSWLPLFVFVLLFGLGMDYHIFVLSRIRERLAAGADARAAIVGGVAASAGVVTAAAVIMTAVFSVFIGLSAIEYKMLGVGMAVAVLIDATLVRGVLLPAALSVIGPGAWGRGR